MHHSEPPQCVLYALLKFQAMSNHPCDMIDFSITSLPITTDSGTFPCSTLVLRLTSNHFYDIIVAPTMPGDYGFPAPPLDSPIVPTTPTIIQDDGRPPDPSQTGNREEAGLLAYVVRKVFRHSRVF